MSELVFGIESKLLEGLDFNREYDTGSPERRAYLYHVLKQGYFKNRADAETDPTFKQIIPYVVFMNDNDEIFSYTRAGSEDRLHNLISVGIGGHINPEDFDLNMEGMLLINIQRELDEEVAIWGKDDDRIFSEDLRLVGPELIIYAGQDIPSYNPELVNQVHLGLMYYCFLGEDQTMAMSSEGKEGKFRTFAELQESSDSLETWSKIVLPYLG